MGSHAPWLKDVQTRFRQELINCTPLKKKNEVFRLLDDVREAQAFSFALLTHLPREVTRIFDELTQFAYAQRLQPEELIFDLIQSEHVKITYGLNRRSEDESSKE
ncbi:MAG TPA: hypothetical protein VF209_01190 [Patescibacteria group bacterium]